MTIAIVSRVGFRGLQSPLTALGSSQTTAFPLLASADNIFGTVAASTGAILPVVAPPDEVGVWNGGASTLTIYPPVGGTINGGSVNSSVSLTAGSGVTFTAVDALTWDSLSGSGGAVPATGGTITQSLLAIATPAYASTINLDLSTASIFAPAALTGSPALTLTNAPAASPWVRPFSVILTQGGAGSYTVTSWFTGFTVDWAGGAAPTLTTAVGKRDVVNFIQIAATTLLGSVVGQNY